MNYRVRRQGEDLGMFPLEELRRRRQSGEFTGAEYVQAEGTGDWQPLDLILQFGYRLTPPPLPPSASRSSQGLVWGAICVGVLLLFIVAITASILMNRFQKNFPLAPPSSANNGLNSLNGEAVEVASKPVLWNTNTGTYLDEQKRDGDFRRRQWVDGYEKNGERVPAIDAEADLFVRTYISRNYGGPEATNSLSLADESDKLGNDVRCTDPLVLTVAADNSLNQFDAMERFDRALAAYPASKHLSYPRLYATLKLAGLLGDRSDRSGELQTSALRLFKQCFADGSFTPQDEQVIGEIFVNGWGYDFFRQNAASVCSIVREQGPDYHWLALTLDGEHEIIQAWAARGGGYADSVSDEGWRGFNSHLAAADTDLTAAWTLQPDWPLAPERMIYVSLGEFGLADMRKWFDRTTQAQVDYARAWSDLRWGLRPRWYGNEQAMLGLGVAAVNSCRFDTDVPRKYIDCINDVESEMGLPAGQHIYGRADIWPNLKRMYDGYVSAPSQKDDWAGWRTSYAVVAYFAHHYDVARAQLEALDWKPLTNNMENWDVDLSLMPLEVAARTGPLGKKVSLAEIEYHTDEIRSALDQYNQLKGSPEADERTRDFIQCRLSELSAEDNLRRGQWICLMPKSDDDPNWVYSLGTSHVLPDGALQVEFGPRGHMLYSRVRAGENFEVRGQIELVHSANNNFQGGLVMGVPNFDGYQWYGFRLKRHGGEGDSVCFARGWSRRQIVQNIVLNDVTNTFDMTFSGGRVTASVNGVNVFDRAAPPVDLYMPNNSYMVGLGAFSDSPDTIIRYRGVQMRRL